jgi:hypothetical protein
MRLRTLCSLIDYRPYASVAFRTKPVFAARALPPNTGFISHDGETDSVVFYSIFRKLSPADALSIYVGSAGPLLPIAAVFASVSQTG